MKKIVAWLKKKLNFFKEQLDTGGVGYEEILKRQEQTKKGPAHLKYLLPIDTPKCPICNIMPATETNSLGESFCVQCR